MALLKFLGVNGGSSDSHTNAFFFPDPETLVFLDLSLRNFRKARRILTENKARLKRVIVLLTHLHPDHASGVIMLAYAVRHELKDATLEVITDVSLGDDVAKLFDAEGGRISYIEEEDGKLYPDKIYELYMLRMLGEGTRFHLFTHSNGTLVPPQGGDVDKLIPRWFFRAIPTEHAPRLEGATGFELEVEKTRIIYSGDTSTFAPFFRAVEAAAEEDAEKIELYVECSTTKLPVHLFLPEIKSELLELLIAAPNLDIIFMHYDNRYKVAKEVIALNLAVDAKDNPRVFLAENFLF